MLYQKAINIYIFIYVYICQILVCNKKYTYLAESISLLRDSKSDDALGIPGFIPMLLAIISKNGANR